MTEKIKELAAEALDFLERLDWITEEEAEQEYELLRQDIEDAYRAGEISEKEHDMLRTI